MATVKRTATAYRTPQRPPQPEQPIEEPLPDENRWDDNPPEVEAEAEAEQLPVSDVVPVGVEQLERSQEMEAMGIANWVAAHDERDPDQQPQQIAGVTPLER
jgi:hypothetical protein